MKLATIFPASYGGGWSSEGYHMALGQSLVLNKDYRRWYKSAHARGAFILVDNGAAEPPEERVPFEEIVNVVLEIRADEIVLPDVLYDGPATYALTIEAVQRFGGRIPPKMRMIVPQGNTREEWLECLQRIDADLPCYRTIGIPKHTERFPGGRAGLLQDMKRSGYLGCCDVHLLGVYRDAKEEIHAARRVYDHIRGIDTGAPVAFAQYKECIDKPINGRRALDNDLPADIRLVERNIAVVEEWCNEPLQSSLVTFLVQAVY